MESVYIIFKQTKNILMNIISKILFSGLLLASVTQIQAQKQLVEGTITYNITITSAKSEAPVANGLNGASLKIYLNSKESRSEMTSTLGTETNVFDNTTGKGFILKEYSGQKLMITLNKQNWLQKNEWNDNLKFTIGSQVENIAGYSCKKATGVSDDGRTITVYFTPSIVIANKKYNSSFDQLPGLPVKYEVKSGNLVFNYTLDNLNYDPVAATMFDAPKSGFRIMTYEENQQLKKG